MLMLATAQLLEICVFLLYLEVVVIFQLDSIKDLVLEAAYLAPC